MTSSSAPSTENPCFDAVPESADFPKNNDCSLENNKDEEEDEDEEGDVDFNPFLKEALSLEASSSLSSEIEEIDADVVDSGENHSHNLLTKAPDNLQDSAVGDIKHGEEIMMQNSDSSTKVCKKRKLPVICEPDYTTVREKENEPKIAINTVNDVTIEDAPTALHSQKLIINIDDEDAICRRTRARYSLASFTLDELETFLQETDDEDDLYNVDDEEEYRKFLAAVLQGGDASSGAVLENENVDEEDEDNDADFELEIEEALESDVDETLRGVSRDGRRPETRQEKRQKADPRYKKKLSGQMNRPLRPILPYTPIVPAPDLTHASSFANNDYASVFTPQQIGQLHCLIYEHVQLLVQVFSLSVLEPSRQHIVTQVQGLLSEILEKRDQVLALERDPHPSSCFDPQYIHSIVTKGDVQPMEGVWLPSISDHVISVIDVAPLKLIGSYMDDVSVAVHEHQRRLLEVTYDASIDKECLFPYETFQSSAEPNGVSPATTMAPSSVNDQKPKKTLAAALVERSKKQSIAPVPKQIANLAVRFCPLFNPALFPHKPPPASVANRVLFTDAEDGLLARGLMIFNTDWKAIQKNLLPCKSTHQIFIRQKNRACTRAPENPIKAVRRMKTSPLTDEEKAWIAEGIRVYKLDWMSVWKYMVPHRDPSLLARQWRVAIGNQKSYKGDEKSKAKRRLYEFGRRRKSKYEGSREGLSVEKDVNLVPESPLPSNKENCSTDNGGGENNSGDDGVDNEEEAYVHEAFLANWRPVSNLGENQLTNSSTQEGFHAHSLTNNTMPICHDLQNPNSGYSKSSRSSETKLHLRPYRARKSDYPRVVKLAPDLPAVNLPPTVRIMSESAFTKYRDENISVKEKLVSTSNSSTSGQDTRNLDKEKEDSALRMHPLLFQSPEDGSLPYYPLNGSAGSSSSFDFFRNNHNHLQLNLSLFRYANQARNTVNLSSSLLGVDFHPLLQRPDDGNGHSIATPSVLKLSPESTMAVNGSSMCSPNELDLDIGLSFSVRKENGGAHESGAMETEHSGSENHENGLDSGARLLGINGNDSRDQIVMEQEELSDSEEEEMTECVEFECEEMTDSEGEGESDSDPVDIVQTEDVQDDLLPKVMLHEENSDTDEPRWHNTPSKADLVTEKFQISKKNETSSSVGLSLDECAPPLAKSKLPVTRKCRNSATPAKKPRKRAQKLDPR